MSFTETDVRKHTERVLGEIRSDMVSGAIPWTVSTFSELHDYVDANMYLTDEMYDDSSDPDDPYAFANAVSGAVDAALPLLTTKRTDELAPGDVILFPQTDDHDIAIPLINAAGIAAAVQSVSPWMLTAGPRAGQQATDGPGTTGAPLFQIVIDHSTGKLGNPAAPADQNWTICV